MLNLENYKPVKIDNLVLAEWNYKTNDERLQKKLTENIRKSGQIENILVRELSKGKFEVVNGNHRLLALKELGYNEVMTYNLGKIDLSTAKRIAIETNETKFATDNLKLAEILSDLQIEFPDLSETVPFSVEELENYSKLLQFDWNDDNENVSDSFDSDLLDSSKSETLISAGPDKFKTIKLEVAPDLYSLFETVIFNYAKEVKSSEDAFKLMLNILNDIDQKEIKKLAKKYVDTK